MQHNTTLALRAGTSLGQGTENKANKVGSPIRDPLPSRCDSTPLTPTTPQEICFGTQEPST